MTENDIRLEINAKIHFEFRLRFWTNVYIVLKAFIHFN